MGKKSTIKINHTTIEKEEEQAVKKVLRSKHLERGRITSALERQAEKKFGVKRAVAVSSGTGGLIAALASCGVGIKDEVVTTPFTFAATVNSIALLGAEPIYADINKESFNLNTNEINKKITKRTKAILTVDLYGNPADYAKIRDIADKYNLFIIADSSQSIGALFNGAPVSNFSDLQILSFFGTKSLTSGEGGMVLTNNKRLADKVNLLINHGQKRGETYNYLTVGWNFRPTDLQSALIALQLKRLDSIIIKRINNATYLNRALNDIFGLVTPKIEIDIKHVFSRYTIRVTEKFPLSRDGLKEYLIKRGVETQISYPKTLNQYQHLTFGVKKGELPVAEEISRQVLSLPIHQGLKRRDLNYLSKCFDQFR